jgi:pyruvate carboxylase
VPTSSSTACVTATNTAAITAPKAGNVQRVAVLATAQVEGGDLLVVS